MRVTLSRDDAQRVTNVQFSEMEPYKVVHLYNAMVMNHLTVWEMMCRAEARAHLSEYDRHARMATIKFYDGGKMDMFLDILKRSNHLGRFEVVEEEVA